MRSIEKALGYLTGRKYRELAEALGRRMPSWLFRRRAAYVLEVRNDGMRRCEDRPPALPDGYSLRTAAFSELPACAEMAGVAPEEYARRFSAGDECHAIFAGGRPACLTWLHAGPCYVRGLGFVLEADPSECYVYGSFTAPAHRNKGLYRASQSEVIRVMFSRGTRRAIAIVEEGNRPVLATLPKLGYGVTRLVKRTTLCAVTTTVVLDAAGTVIRRHWRWHWRTPHHLFRI